jgi:drug/metabolite transporter (DMT)-like permease
MPNALLYALTVLIWGSTWFAVSFQIGEVHPLLSVCYRFTAAALTLFIFLVITGRLKNARFTARQHVFIALQGLFLFCLNFWLFYQGTAYLTTGLVSVVFSSMSLLNTLNQALFFGIPFNRKVIVGSMIGLTGIILVFWPEIDSLSLKEGKIIGIALCLAGSYSASLGNMVSLRNTRSGIPVIEGNAMGMVYGAAYSFILALLAGAPLTFAFTPSYIISLLYLSVFGSAVAFGCYLTLVHRIGADKAAYATILFPIVALTISTFFEGYVWTPGALAGIALILFGNVITLANRENLLQWRPRRAREIIRTGSAAESPESEPTADSPK